MVPEFFQYIVIISISGVLSLILAIYAFIKRDKFTSSTTFVLMSIFSVIYIFGHAFEISSDSLEEIMFWIKVQYLGMPYISPLSLLLAIHFAGLERFNRPKIIFPLFFIPIITMVMILTNDFHHFFYRHVYLRPNEAQPSADMIAGPWYIIHGSYTFGCMILGTFILLWYWKQTKAYYWKQVVTMLLGLIIPMTASFLYLIGISPHGMDPVPIVMCFTSALYLWAILSTKLFVLAPIARNRIFEIMRDGVLVIDRSNRLVDYNHMAVQAIPTLHSSAIGKDLKMIWNTGDIGPFPLDEKEMEIEWTNPLTNMDYDIRSTPVFNNHKIIIGNIIALIDITRQKTLEKKLTQLAYTDGLTNIYNRSYLMERSQAEMKLARQNNKPFSLVIFDIDFFKKINDGYGHSTGDLAICHVVSICKSQLQPEYIFGRYGGEEFVVSMPDTDLYEAAERAENIRKAIETTPLIVDDVVLPITASFGLAQIQEQDYTLDFLLNEADRALYSSKAGGRNTVHLASNGTIIPYVKQMRETALSHRS